MPGLISAIIPCFNHAKYLERAVASVLSQQDVDVEIIIVDDGSTDDTPGICAKLAQQSPRVRYIRKLNGGLSSARNAGIAAALGHLVHFLDADDYISPTMYASVSTYFADHPGIEVVYTGFEMLDETTNCSKSVEAPSLCRPMVEELLICNIFPVHAVIIKKACLERIGEFDESLRTCEDWDLWLRAAMAGARFGRVVAPLATYVLRPNSISKDYLRMVCGGKRVLEKVESQVRGRTNLELCWSQGARDLRRWFFGWAADPGLSRLWRQRQLLRLFASSMIITARDPKSCGLVARWFWNQARRVTRL